MYFIRVFTSKHAYGSGNLAFRRGQTLKIMLFLCFIRLFTLKMDIDFARKNTSKKHAAESARDPLILALLLHKKQLPPPVRHASPVKLGWAVEGLCGLVGWLAGWLGWLGWLAGRLVGW